MIPALMSSWIKSSWPFFWRLFKVLFLLIASCFGEFFYLWRVMLFCFLFILKGSISKQLSFDLIVEFLSSLLIISIFPFYLFRTSICFNLFFLFHSSSTRSSIWAVFLFLSICRFCFMKRKASSAHHFAYCFSLSLLLNLFSFPLFLLSFLVLSLPYSLSYS